MQWVRSGLETWQVYAIFGILGSVACVTIYIVSREIWYAIHPDKKLAAKRRLNKREAPSD